MQRLTPGILLFVVMFLCCASIAKGQSRWGRVLSSAVKTYQASTITDEELAEYVSKGVKDMDRKNRVYGPATNCEKHSRRHPLWTTGGCN